MTREILQERLNRPLPVAPALAFFDTDPPAHRARGPTKPCSAALGSGGLHWSTGRCRGWRPSPPASGAVAGAGGGIGAHGGRRSGRRGPIPKTPDGLPDRIGVIGALSRPEAGHHGHRRKPRSGAETTAARWELQHQRGPVHVIGPVPEGRYPSVSSSGRITFRKIAFSINSADSPSTSGSSSTVDRRRFRPSPSPADGPRRSARCER